YEHKLAKKFTNLAQADAYYQECLTSGVFDVLQHPPVEDEVLLVVKGAKPGVYTKRLTFLIEGLAWRGGVVMSAIGPRARADIQFRRWEVAGQTEVLP
ncbi:hypothetical protein BT96DRAFT_801708, partial [Gymnopus androsaceus JB14]